MAQAAKRIEPEQSGDDIKQRLTGFEQRLVVLETKSQHFVSDAALADFRTEVLTAIANLSKEIAESRADAAERDARMMEKFAELMEKFAGQTEKMADQTEKIAKLETQSERNSKNNIKWIVGTGVALAGVIFAMFQTMLPAA